MATSALDCGPMIIFTPRRSSSVMALSACDGSSCVSRTKKWNRYPPYWLIASASRCSSAICSAATVFCPREDHEPVNDASTPTLNTRWECCWPDGSPPARPTKARTSPHTMTRKTKRIFISARPSSYPRHCQGRSNVSFSMVLLPRRAQRPQNKNKSLRSPRSLWLIYDPNAAYDRFLPAEVENFHCLRAHAKHSRHARDEIRRSLGPGRNFKFQTAPEWASVFHAQRPARPDRVRDLARYHVAAATTAYRWSASAGLRHCHGVRSTRAIPAQCPNSSAARSRPAPSKIRSAETQARSGRIVHARTQTAVAEISTTNWDRDLADRSSDSRHAERAAPTSAVVADCD